MLAISRPSGHPYGPRGADGEVAAPQDAVGPIAVDERVERGQIVGAHSAVEAGPDASQGCLSVTAGGGGKRGRQIDGEVPLGLDGEAGFVQARSPVGAEMRYLVGQSFGQGG